jgi:hypothetical protein
MDELQHLNIENRWCEVTSCHCFRWTVLIHAAFDVILREGGLKDFLNKYFDIDIVILILEME